MIGNFSESRGGFVVCHVCGMAFNPSPERRYTVKEKDGIGAIVGNTYYDAFDCPHCGCQNIVGLRLDPIFVKPREEAGDDEEPTEDVTVTTETTVEIEAEEGRVEPADYMNE